MTSPDSTARPTPESAPPQSPYPAPYPSPGLYPPMPLWGYPPIPPAGYAPMPAYPVGYYALRPQPRNGLGLASVILGPIGLLPSLLTLAPIIGLAYMVFALPLAGTGLGLGIAGLRRVRAGVATNRGATKTGLWFSAIDLGLMILGIVIAIIAAHNATPTSGCVPIQGYSC